MCLDERVIWTNDMYKHDNGELSLIWTKIRLSEFWKTALRSEDKNNQMWMKTLNSISNIYTTNKYNGEQIAKKAR